ncbi:hypothetical protein AAFF_G00399550 [Aldrovandia affinis]|uniref:Uncharacterized protein n=1 Tax=Aldrovandia affinis TaxID=143900 RepID=A0AAD7SCV8_9TELE|nr:hypothetical protein AAFF_G00399550 [Aldrovandia affinis]
MAEPSCLSENIPSQHVHSRSGASTLPRRRWESEETVFAIGPCGQPDIRATAGPGPPQSACHSLPFLLSLRRPPDYVNAQTPSAASPPPPFDLRGRTVIAAPCCFASGPSHVYVHRILSRLSERQQVEMTSSALHHTAALSEQRHVRAAEADCSPPAARLASHTHDPGSGRDTVS